MQRTTFLCLIIVMLLFVRSTTAGDKKGAPKTLAEEAERLAGRWMSEGTVKLWTEDDGFKEAKIKLHFNPRGAKPSGEFRVGLATFKKNGEIAIFHNQRLFRFELIEERGRRAIKLTHAPLGGPPPKDPRSLNYSLVGDKITIDVPLADGWGGAVLPMTFKFDKK
jgi:hypothetical protein